VIYSGAFGKRDAGSNIAVTPDSIFQIASMTKPVTSVAALQLVEQGKVKLDEPVGTFLPKLAKPQLLEGFTASGDPILRPAKTAITLRHLLTHTSGISYPTWHANMNRYAEKYPAGSAIAPVVPLMFEPGTNWQYGYGLDWVGRLVEAISGLTLQQYFRRNILDPLDMTDTEFGVPAAKFDRVVSLYRRSPDGKFQGGEHGQPPAPYTDFNGGGGLSTTTGDYMKFTRMLLNKGQAEGKVQILQAATIESLFKNQIGGIRAGFMKSQSANVSADVDTHPGGVDKWGLIGLLHGSGTKGIRSEGSTAWAGIYNTYFWIDPKKNVSGVIMMQYLPFFDPEAIGLLGDFERAVYANL
jgi:CubicO group peptidase (beta-lactamase class C family)